MSPNVGVLNNVTCQSKWPMHSERQGLFLYFNCSSAVHQLYISSVCSEGLRRLKRHLHLTVSGLFQRRRYPVSFMHKGQRSLVMVNTRLFSSPSGLSVKLKAEWFLSVSYWVGDLQKQASNLALFPKEITSLSPAVEDNNCTASPFDSFLHLWCLVKSVFNKKCFIRWPDCVTALVLSALVKWHKYSLLLLVLEI